MSNVLSIQRRTQRAKPVAIFGPQLHPFQFRTYQPGQHCLNCDNGAWEIRTVTATCMACGEVLSLKNSTR